MEAIKISKHVAAVVGDVNESKRKAAMFDSKQVSTLRDLANTQFEALQHRVENLKNEVFNEIMEAEMIMTGLCDEEFEKHVPEDVMDEQNRSLLKRMHMLK